jgi:hypothetical protein
VLSDSSPSFSMGADIVVDEGGRKCIYLVNW